MFENMTYETIKKRMLKQLSANLDKREGSVIDTALAPAAAELTSMYIGLDWTLDQVFAGTQGREYLIRRCAERGMTPKAATFALLKGEFNINIPMGSRFSLETLNYEAVEKISDGIYRMRCETAGAEGNRYLGQMIPIEYINGLARAELTEVLEPGEDEESTESLRERFLIQIQKPSTSGNKYDYYNWAMACQGVGAAKVFPLANGPGTVKVVISDGDMGAASPELVDQVAGVIEEKRPIGADVTVESAREKPIHISAKIKQQNGVDLGAVQGAFQNLVKEFLREKAFRLSYVSLAQVGRLLLETAGIEDYSEIMLNGSDGNVTLADEEIAVPGTVALEVMP